MTSAYSVFPNGGVRMRPYPILKISDRDGNLLEESRPDPQDAIRADTAFVMTSLLRGVVQRGTAGSASKLGWPLGGKTGTTDDYGDAWFIGFDPDITVGVWVGHDERKPIGHNETGGVAALPIWIEFMRAYIETRDPKNPPDFVAPGQHRLRAGQREQRQRCRGRRDGHQRGVHLRHTARDRVSALTFNLDAESRDAEILSMIVVRSRDAQDLQLYSSSSAVGCPNVPDAFCIRYALMNGSRSPSSTRLGSPTSNFVRWSFTS